MSISDLPGISYRTKIKIEILFFALVFWVPTPDVQNIIITEFIKPEIYKFFEGSRYTGI